MLDVPFPMLHAIHECEDSRTSVTQVHIVLPPRIDQSKHKHAAGCGAAKVGRAWVRHHWSHHSSSDQHTPVGDPAWHGSEPLTSPFRTPCTPAAQLPVRPAQSKHVHMKAQQCPGICSHTHTPCSVANSNEFSGSHQARDTC